MAAPSKSIFVSGLNAGRFYALSGDYPTGGTATPYDGIAIGGPISLDMTFGDPSTVVFPGNDIILQQDTFTTEEPTTGVLTVSRMDYDTMAFLNNIKVAVVGEMNMIGWGTDQQGNEPTIAGLFYQRGKLTNGSRGWHTYVVPRMTAIPKAGGMINREPTQHIYNLSVQYGTQHLTGVDFSVAVDGYTSGQVVDIESNHRIHIVQWTSVANATEFTLNPLLPCYAAAKIKVSLNGAAYTTEGAGADLLHSVSTTTKVTFGAATTTGDKVVAIYELDDTASDLA
jgi:hypothetical protein